MSDSELSRIEAIGGLRGACHRAALRADPLANPLYALPK
jgi:hypothetical protein